MSPRSLVTHLLAALMGAGICGLIWYQKADTGAPAVSEKRVRLLETENERLRGLVEKAEKSRLVEESRKKAAEIERAVEEIRGLKFKQPVDYNILSRKEIKDVVSKKLSDVYSEEEFAHTGAALSRLGLLPDGYPLREKYVELLGEQIAAFYDQHTHKLYMFEDASLDNAQNRVILAHELMHAMQDQHFGLKKLPLEIKTNDDKAVAASALAEGEATLVMSEYMLKNLSLATLKDTMASTLTQNMEQLQNAPRYLRETLIFPYLRGQEFCTSLYTRGGYEAIGQAYANIPSSTSQILHPEKYLVAPREDPLPVDWPRTEFRGAQPTVDNVVGEFGIRQLLAHAVGEKAAEDAAAGWRGDRYLSFGAGESLIWKSLWRTEAEAEEFMTAYQTALEKRYKPQKPRVGPDSFEADEPRAIRLRRNGAAVVMADAATPDLAAELIQTFGE